MKYINEVNINKYNCSGCTACKSICPQKCISMNNDNEGFLYPKVNIDLCIHCGKCVKVCPWLSSKREEKVNYPIVYAAKNISDEIRQASASGGVFSAIAEYVISNSGVVYGAAYDKMNHKVVHIDVTSKEELGRLRGSKYVQSELNNSFIEIQGYLLKGKKVLFTGTPCQCAGLKAFLGKEYDNLVIVDILCHSTPSPKILQDTILSYGGNVTNIKFRDKSLGWRNSYHFELFDSGHSKTNETYLTLFFKGLINRPSCYKCKFKSSMRQSDITIGDYWNINKVKPEFEDALGVSCILVNNDKGARMIECIKDYLVLYETSLSSAIQDCMSRNVKEPKNRKLFWNDYNRKGFLYCEQKYGHMSKWEIFRDRTLAPIVRKIKRIVKYGR